MFKSPRQGLPPPPVPRIQAPTANASMSSSASSRIRLRYHKIPCSAKFLGSTGNFPQKIASRCKNRVGTAVKTPRYQVVGIIDSAYRRHHNREFRPSKAGKNRRNREITGKLVVTGKFVGSPGPNHPSLPRSYALILTRKWRADRRTACLMRAGPWLV